jgi:predicted aldo/keto reductase-like oxidoreductase
MKISNKKMNRREMLRLTALGGLAGAFLPAAISAEMPAAPAAQPALPKVPRRVLGKTKQSIPILLMGGGMGYDQKFDPRLAECMRFGVNYFDVADCYAGGTSETGLGAFVEKTGKRKEMWITTKSDDHTPAGLEQILNRSLERLKTDHVEMMFMHMLRDPKYLNSDMAAMTDKLRKAGKIRFFGFSCHHHNVAELLAKAAGLPWIDAIMFRYNFREYGNQELNAAMDACHKAGVGLIAMKTQGSAVSFEDRVSKFDSTKFTRQQAVLKAVWADERITAAVSHMDTLDKIKQNAAAALDQSKLTEADHAALQQYARDTRHLYCAGCQHICGRALPAGIEVGTTLRYLMYHDTYRDPEMARALYERLPEEAKRIEGVDFTEAATLCPHRIDIAKHMQRAAHVLA